MLSSLTTRPGVLDLHYHSSAGICSHLPPLGIWPRTQVANRKRNHHFQHMIKFQPTVSIISQACSFVCVRRGGGGTQVEECTPHPVPLPRMGNFHITCSESSFTMFPTYMSAHHHEHLSDKL